VKVWEEVKVAKINPHDEDLHRFYSYLKKQKSPH